MTWGIFFCDDPLIFSVCTWCLACLSQRSPPAPPLRTSSPAAGPTSPSWSSGSRRLKATRTASWGATSSGKAHPLNPFCFYTFEKCCRPIRVWKYSLKWFLTHKTHISYKERLFNKHSDLIRSQPLITGLTCANTVTLTGRVCNKPNWL